MPTRGASEDDFESSKVRFLSSEPGDKFRQTSHHHCDWLGNYKGFLLYTFPRETWSNIKSVEYSVGKGPERPRLIIGDEKIFARNRGIRRRHELICSKDVGVGYIRDICPVRQFGIVSDLNSCTSGIVCDV